MQIGNGTFYHGDCLEVMRGLPDASVDMILCDLPYGTTACSWDSVIPFEPLWEQYWRVAKPNAAVVLTASQPFTTALIASQIGRFKYCWVWEKEQGVNFMLAKKQPLKVHEDICVFSRSAAPYFPQMTEGKPYVSGKGNSGAVTGSREKVQTVNSGTRYPRSVIPFNRQTGAHPTQKPVALFEYLVRTYTQPGEVVLDNCMGRGTTAIAAERSGRKWIGIERDAGYYNAALVRIWSEVYP